MAAARLRRDDAAGKRAPGLGKAAGHVVQLAVGDLLAVDGRKRLVGGVLGLLLFLDRLVVAHLLSLLFDGSATTELFGVASSRLIDARGDESLSWRRLGFRRKADADERVPTRVDEAGAREQREQYAGATEAEVVKRQRADARGASLLQPPAGREKRWLAGLGVHAKMDLGAGGDATAEVEAGRFGDWSRQL